MDEWLFASAIVFLASALQCITGFGFAIMATPFLLLVFDSRDNIQMSIILSFFIAIVLTPKIRHHIHYGLLKRLILGSILGVPLGLWFFAHVSLDILKMTVSLVILTVAFFLLAKWLQNKTKTVSDPPGECVLNETEIPEEPVVKSVVECFTDPAKRNELCIGLFAGTLTTSIGMPGVPLALYFTAKNEKKEIIRSTTLAFFIVVYIFSMVLQVLTVKISWSVATSSLLLIPAAAAGVFLGNSLFAKINQRMFQLIANLILIYTGFYMIIKTF